MSVIKFFIDEKESLRSKNESKNNKEQFLI